MQSEVHNLDPFPPAMARLLGNSRQGTAATVAYHALHTRSGDLFPADQPPKTNLRFRDVFDFRFPEPFHWGKGTAQLYIDGSCLKNPDGPGGWSVVVTNSKGKVAQTLCGHSASTTNNRMELTAAIVAVAGMNGGWATIYSDSRYIVDGITKWVPSWKTRGWLKKSKKGGRDIKNLDLWQLLDFYTNPHIKWVWVKGHNGNTFNEMADSLANQAAQENHRGNHLTPREIDGKTLLRFPSGSPEQGRADLYNQHSDGVFTPTMIPNSKLPDHGMGGDNIPSVVATTVSSSLLG